MVWDCGTGNGQAARDLARYFDRVIATDASQEQLANAVAAPNVDYRVATAEASGLPDHSMDAVTVAQALHWFDHDRFYREVRRVTAAGGIIAAWCYGYCHAGPDVESELRDLEEGVLGAYWNPQRRWVAENYRTVPFPFEEVRVPELELRMEWTLTQLGSYIDSWSAVAKYRRVHGSDPVAPALERIARFWGASDRTRQITWPLGIRIGRV